jgi:hypothetical protein
LNVTAQVDSSSHLFAKDFVYKGAFRVYNGSAQWGNAAGFALTYYPKGDPNGSDDGYPGSLICATSEWPEFGGTFGEISIPGPVISSSQNISDLPRPAMLHGFVDITGGMKNCGDCRIGDVLYMPAQGNQTTDKLHWSLYVEYMPDFSDKTQGMSDMNLDNPNPGGLWKLGENFNGGSMGAYLMEIPKAWAGVNTPGQYIATGRYRGPKGGSNGPTLYAYGPWNDGNPPASGSTISGTRLLHYDVPAPVVADTGWPWESGLNRVYSGVWPTAGNKSAMMLFGWRGLGNLCYGCKTDPCFSGKGYSSDPYTAEVYFFSPDHMAQVAKGERPSNLKPYQLWQPNEYFWRSNGTCAGIIGGAAYDREHGLMYLTETAVDRVGYETYPIVHVFSLAHLFSTTESDVKSPGRDGSEHTLHVFKNEPNPFYTNTTIRFRIARKERVKIQVYDAGGALVASLTDRSFDSGTHTMDWNAVGIKSGLFFIRLSTGNKSVTRKVIHIN